MSTTVIGMTISLIWDAHRNQVDKTGFPYWLHPVAVMNRLGDDATLEEKLVALLHDVVEDTPTTCAALSALGYVDTVTAAVAILTKPRGAPYFDWIRSIASSGNRTAIKVKVADNEENADPERLALIPDPEERERLASKYAESLAILRPALEGLAIHEEPR